MSKLIYLDNAATTKTAPEVLEAMLPYFTEQYGNPSAIYSFASHNKDVVAEQRERIANALGAKSNEIYFHKGIYHNTVYRLCHAFIDFLPDIFRDTASLDLATVFRMKCCTSRRFQVSFKCSEYITNRNFRRILCQPISSSRSTDTLDKTCLFQLRHELFQISFRYLLPS